MQEACEVETIKFLLIVSIFLLGLNGRDVREVALWWLNSNDQIEHPNGRADSALL